MGVTEELAQLVVRTRYDDLTPEAKEQAKWAMMDGVATTLAGSVEPAGTIVADLVQELGGLPVATVLGKGVRTSPVWAAYANGTMAHALDYDDISWPMGGIPPLPFSPSFWRWENSIT
jgi:2-methylcitrate dehydratase PrpD